MKSIAKALARFCVSKSGALFAALVLLVAGIVTAATGSIGWGLVICYFGALLFVLVWNHCAAELTRRSGRDDDVDYEE